MAAMLKSAGFEVISGVDLTRDEMVTRISQFADSARDGVDAAVVFSQAMASRSAARITSFRSTRTSIPPTT